MKNIKAYIAEAIGTFVLVFVACGVAAVTHGDVVATALAFGFVIFAMAYTIGDISGCHINPAVSLGCLIAKRMSVKDFVGYVIAQVVGAIVGAIAIFGILKISGFNASFFDGLASNFAIGGDLKVGPIIGSFLLEIILTFIFVYVILSVTNEKSSAGKFAGIIIGITLTLVHLVGIRLTGTSVNPARSLGTALGDLIFSGKADALKHVWIFILAPMGGGGLAAIVYNVANKEKASKKKEAPKEEPKEDKKVA